MNACPRCQANVPLLPRSLPAWWKGRRQCRGCGAILRVTNASECGVTLGLFGAVLIAIESVMPPSHPDNDLGRRDSRDLAPYSDDFQMESEVGGRRVPVKERGNGKGEMEKNGKGDSHQKRGDWVDFPAGYIAEFTQIWSLSPL